jgi:hypothetical protein
MSFRYNAATGHAVDEATGIEIFVKGRGEYDQMPFAFFDPSSSVVAPRGKGTFTFRAKFLYDEPLSKGVDGARRSLKGYLLDRQVLENSFSKYTHRDPQKFQRVCTLVSAGLKEFLKNSGGPNEPVVEIQ